ncbi:hypothetical protein NRIC_29570 [Enterococcus florum]|uniref:Uncharacterized protein n=1 Tax=Enterococcus florum TaxID=2480627 RepID=A0A4P5PBG8_9ENTE|nr:hypothetical protein [Enterococcus florum]GCF95066.1 hypothetical protein NRIC_29570 [Enterococcus florum]
MQAYVEVYDNMGTDYYYAELTVQRQKVILARHQGLYKVKEKELDFSNIHDLSVEQGDKQRQIKFFCGEEHFTFFDEGNGIVSYLYGAFLTA